MRDHIVFLDRSTILAPLPALDFPHKLKEYALTSPEQVLERTIDASVVVSNKVKLDGAVLKQLPRLRLIAIPATGMDHVDVGYCHDAGIAVANCPGYAAAAVAEHAITLMMLLRRNILAYRQDLQAGAWHRSESFFLSNHPVRDLHGSVIGIVGRGILGKQTAALAKAFGAQVVYAERPGVAVPRRGYVQFEAVLREADVLSLHCPLTPDTHRLIGAPELAQMKSSAILVNTARGGLIDEQALLDALQQGRLAGAGLDTLSNEPPDVTNPLLAVNLPNLVITPHVAWISNTAMQRLANQLVTVINQFVNARGAATTQSCLFPN